MKISIQGLCFGYKQRQVLRGVDLEVPSGSLCALLGANGAGKTTLLKCINGILRPQSGRVFADDTDLGSLTARERARLIGYVPQNAQAGGSCLNVLETVLSGRVPHRKGRLKSEDYDIAGQVLESMDLSRYAMRQLNQLSGGERQRVFIARAVAQRPRVMLLDEPTSNLDMRFQQETMEIVKALSAGRGITVITILHDLNLAIVYADQAVLLRDGTVYRAQSPQEALDGANIRDIFGVEVGFAPLDGARYIVPRAAGEGVSGDGCGCNPLLPEGGGDLRRRGLPGILPPAGAVLFRPRGREMRLAAFATCNGCECDPASDEAFQKKLDKLSGAGVEEVHVAACVTGEKRACPRKEAILTALSARGLRVCLLEERA